MLQPQAPRGLTRSPVLARVLLTLDQRHTSCFCRGSSGDSRLSLGGMRKGEVGRCSVPPEFRGRKNWKELRRPSRYRKDCRSWGRADRDEGGVGVQKTAFPSWPCTTEQPEEGLGVPAILLTKATHRGTCSGASGAQQLEEEGGVPCRQHPERGWV